MPLEENVKTLDGIDEKYKSLYVENSEGTFDIDITGLQSALSKERATRKKLEKKLNKKDTPAPTDEELQTQLKEAQQAIKDMKIDSKVKAAALGAGIDPEYIDDVMLLTKGTFVLGNNDSVVVVDAEGDPTGKTVKTYFKSDYKKLKPRFYNGSGKTGSGAQGNLNNNPNGYNGKLKKAIEAKDTLSIISLKNKNLKT